MTLRKQVWLIAEREDGTKQWGIASDFVGGSYKAAMSVISYWNEMDRFFNCQVKDHRGHVLVHREPVKFVRQP